MSLNKKLFKPLALERPKGLNWDAPDMALDKWSQNPMASEIDQAGVISIYEMIGEDWLTGEGVTANKIEAALANIGPNPVTVKINSPGGDVYEGFTIYNLLAEHPAKVTVDVMGIAASAASIIAMAGDEVRMNLGTALMVHNAWGATLGNRHDHQASFELLETIDSAIADVYVANSKLVKADIQRLMDKETYLSADHAVEQGFADTTIDRKPPKNLLAKADTRVSAKRRIEGFLAKAGVHRTEARRLVKDATDTHDAVEDVTHDADILTAVNQLIKTIRS